MSIITIILFFLYCFGLGYSLRLLFKLNVDEQSAGEQLAEGTAGAAGTAGVAARFLITIALGLAILPLLLVLLAVLHIPLDWKILLIVSLIYPAWHFLWTLRNKGYQPLLSKLLNIKQFRLPRSVSKKTLWLIPVLLIIAAAFFMYAKGAFAYPYLENEDPWGHSMGMKYVALEKKAFDPDYAIWQGKVDPILSYIDPYPPAYDILFGILHQTSPDLNWTMKFFNALIIALSLLFFYFFAKEFMHSPAKAALATFILASVPIYLSHFIWAHSLGITIFFPTAYAFLKLHRQGLHQEGLHQQEPHLQGRRHELNKQSEQHARSGQHTQCWYKRRGWFWPALLFAGSIGVTQNVEQPIKLFMILLLLAGIFSIASRKWWKEGFLAIGGGIAASFIWWGTMIHKYSLNGFLTYYGVGKLSVDAIAADAVADSSAAISAGAADAASAASSAGDASLLSTAFSKVAQLLRSLTSPGGSGSRAYLPEDFIFAQPNNAINSPIGIGVVVSLLVLLGLVWVLWKYKRSIVEEKQAWICVTLFWLLLFFWGVNGQSFPVSIIRAPFRAWLYMAIPVALLAAEAVFMLMEKAKQLGISRILRAAVFGIIVLGIIMTSAQEKYLFNTTIWPTSASFASPQEAFEYGAWFAALPDNTPVFTYSARDKLVTGFSAYACPWCEEEVLFREGGMLAKSAAELHAFLKQRGYAYLILNPRMDLRIMGRDAETEQLLQQKYNEILNSGLFAVDHYKENQYIMLKVL